MYGSLDLDLYKCRTGQLEVEMKRKDWFVIPADDALVFGGDSAGKWERAVANRGFDL